LKTLHTVSDKLNIYQNKCTGCCGFQNETHYGTNGLFIIRTYFVTSVMHYKIYFFKHLTVQYNLHFLYFQSITTMRNLHNVLIKYTHIVSE